MAIIRKNNSRKDLADGTPFPGCKADAAGNISITLQIGLHQVIMSQAEWEMLQERVPPLIVEFER